ncbi:MAG: hypothetical protein KGJ57_01510 [Sphingomonadales bacterium]|nr:hypothetical protein [Sphingomonadales bacterium]MDE2168085.1 hypothetical protein [Sphingomonadales bacterium]
MEWLVAIVITAPVFAVVLWSVIHTKRRGPRRGLGGSAMSAFDAGLAVFDPAKARAIEIVAIRKDIGHADEGNQGEKETGDDPLEKG